MPTLNWIGKEAVIDHHRRVPLRLLECDPALSAGDPDAGNLLVQGDNLEAHKALLPRYKGQVKCIYIDAPYNTGNEGWIYNDNVNDPRIKKWLGEVVGKEAEDLCRHDKWLCMMYPRLALLKEFLSEDGAIFVSIDDTEVHCLRMMMDEIFSPSRWVCTLIWKRRQASDSRNLNGVSADHEFVLCYGASDAVRFLGRAKDLTKYSNPDNDPNGPWMSDNLTGLANATKRPNLHYKIVHPETGQRYPPHASRGGIYGPERMAELVRDGRILWPKKTSGRPRLKRYMSDMRSETTGFSTLLDAPANVIGTKELSELLGPKVFAFPKPHGLVKTLIEQVADANAIILDSFAGSGTTGQAVEALNREDKGNRQFILVEMDANVATQIASKRLPAILQEGDDRSAGFRYCRLGKTLFSEHGEINRDVLFTDLARYVYLIETGTPAPTRPRRDNPLLGVHQSRAVYLLYNGVLGDKRPAGGNVLTHATLDALPPHPDGPAAPRVVYGEACRLSEATLAKLNVTFRQTPYALREG